MKQLTIGNGSYKLIADEGMQLVLIDRNGKEREMQNLKETVVPAGRSIANWVERPISKGTKPVRSQLDQPVDPPVNTPFKEREDPPVDTPWDPPTTEPPVDKPVKTAAPKPSPKKTAKKK
jgi:hypothetical protein